MAATTTTTITTTTITNVLEFVYVPNKQSLARRLISRTRESCHIQLSQDYADCWLRNKLYHGVQHIVFDLRQGPMDVDENMFHRILLPPPMERRLLHFLNHSYRLENHNFYYCCINFAWDVYEGIEGNSHWFVVPKSKMDFGGVIDEKDMKTGSLCFMYDENNVKDGLVTNDVFHFVIYLGKGVYMSQMGAGRGQFQLASRKELLQVYPSLHEMIMFTGSMDISRNHVKTQEHGYRWINRNFLVVESNE